MARQAEEVTGTVTVSDGVHLHYVDRGQGPVLLLVHGMWGSSRFFARQIGSLSNRYRVIAPDLRGHGRSSMTLSDQAVPCYARDMRQFLRKLGVESFVAVGWSMGAFVCWDYVRQFGPAGMRGLVVIDQPPSDWQSEQIPDALISHETLRLWHYRLLTERNALIREIVPMMFAKQPSPEDMVWMFDEMTRAPEAVAAAILVDQSLREYQDVLKDFPVPTLVCGGGRSAQPREGLELIVKYAANASLSIFEDCGHCLFIENPDRFNSEVDRFASALPE